MDLLCNIGSATLVVSGTIAGSVTLNPIITGSRSLSGAGIVLATLLIQKKRITNEKLK